MTPNQRGTEKQIEILEKAYQAVWEFVAGKADSNDPVLKALNDMQAAIISLPYDLEAERGIDGASDRARARREAVLAKQNLPTRYHKVFDERAENARWLDTYLSSIPSDESEE